MAKRSVPPAQYVRKNWNQFTDGAWWTLYADKDFAQKPKTAAKAFRQWAYRQGFKPHVRVGEDSISIRIELEGE